MNSLFKIGRILLGACFILDAGWAFLTYDLRVAYMDSVDGPYALIWITALIYLIFGLALMVNYKPRLTSVPLAIGLFVMSLVLLTDLNGGGIGDYPVELHGEVIFKEWLVHLAIIGGLLVLAGQSDVKTTSRGTVELTRMGLLGRAMVGGYFVVNGLWQWYYFDIRLEHIVASGGTGDSLPLIIAIQLICGALTVSGHFLKSATIPLMVIITVSTIVVHGNLSDTAPYPANLQIHQWFVKASILAGLFMILGLRPHAFRTKN